MDGYCKDSAQYGDRSQVFQGAWQIVAGQAVQPVQILPAAKPGKLPLGQLARCNDAALLHFIPCQLSIQVIPDLAITDGSYRWQT